MDFGIGNVVVYGLGSVAVFGGLFVLLRKLFTRSTKEKITDLIRRETHQADTVNKIQNITKEQQIIAKQIKASELASEETKKKIKDQLRKAAVDIQQILKEDSISTIDKDLDAAWDEL